MKKLYKALLGTCMTLYIIIKKHNWLEQCFVMSADEKYERELSKQQITIALHL